MDPRSTLRAHDPTRTVHGAEVPARREVRGKGTFAAGLAFVGLLSGVSCGARTQLVVDEIAEVVDLDAGRDAPDLEPKTPCIDGTFDLARARAEVLFVVDRSGSMAYALDGDRATLFNPSRWSILRNALAPALGSLGASVRVGAKFFPDTTASSIGPSAQACSLSSGLDVAPELGTRDAILSTFATTSPRGGTPTAAAITAGAAALRNSGSRSVSKFMVLATDGAPNCNGTGRDPKTCVCASPDPTDCSTSRRSDAAFQCLDDGDTVKAIETAANVSKIPTFVIGIGQDQRDVFEATLEKMALAGGRPRAAIPRYYRVLESRDLDAAFTQIEASITLCTFVTPSKPDDVSAIQVSVAGETVPYDPTRTNGWDYVDAAFGEIALFGEACTRARFPELFGTDGGTTEDGGSGDGGADASGIDASARDAGEGGTGEGFVTAKVTCAVP
ncbi:MAG: vWA domain-containing protein [Polyangiaceae bacterium]